MGTDELKTYDKYYDLERYLFDEVGPSFRDKHFLSIEQFFLIVAWKNPKFGIRRISQLREENAVREITEKIFSAGSPHERLAVLLKEESGQRRHGIKLATASAVLTVLYPEEYTVYDIRVRKQLRKRGLWSEDPDDITDDKDVVDKYFRVYLPKIKLLAQESGLSLRDCDRALWAQDWYEDFKDFIKGTT